MDIMLVVHQDGCMRPATPEDGATITKHWKVGETAMVTVRKPRNGAFLRKFFALVNFLYEYWEPGISEYKGMAIQKNIERFRADLTIAAGFHEMYVNAITGEVRYMPKSISFAAMEDDEFEKLFSAVINIGLARILPDTFAEGDVRKAVENELMGFA